MQYSRYSEPAVREALRDTPVILIHGSRQCGKTTLAQVKDACAEHFAAGVVFYDGDSILPFGERLFAVPISILTPQPPANAPLEAHDKTHAP